jgi:GT2 family glycosyltransferase
MSLPASESQKVTVYIPAYNVAEFLERCIESLLKQTMPADEILVIDDGSRDNSAEIARRYQQVKLIQHSVNKGLAAGRNTALHAARNHLIASIDADCVAAPTWLEQLVKNLDGPQTAGVGGKLIEGIQDTTADRWRAVHMAQHWGNTLVRDPRFLFGCNCLFRKEALLSVGGYDERMRTNGEDTDISYRLRQKNFELVYAPSAQATHLRHDTTRSILETHWRWWRFGANAYADGVSLRSVLGHAIFVHFRYNFLEPFGEDVHAGRWRLAAFDFLILFYFPYRDFQLWLNSRNTSVKK